MPGRVMLERRKLRPNVKRAVESLLDARKSHAENSVFSVSSEEPPLNSASKPAAIPRFCLSGYKGGSKSVRSETRRVYSEIMRNKGFAGKGVKFDPAKQTAFVDAAGNLHLRPRTLRERLLFKLQDSPLKGMVPGRYRLR